MSYILDALKKADRDRRETRVPSLGTMHEAPVERRPAWPWVVGGIVALNVAAVGAYVVSRDAPVAVPPAPVVMAPRTVTPAVDTRAAGPPPVAVKQVEPVAPGVSSASPAPERAATTREAGTTRESDELKLEVLVYSHHAAERAVYINGRRYVEGDRVNARFLIERITSDAVVLVSGDTRQVLKQR